MSRVTVQDWSDEQDQTAEQVVAPQSQQYEQPAVQQEVAAPVIGGEIFQAPVSEPLAVAEEPQAVVEAPAANEAPVVAETPVEPSYEAAAPQGQPAVKQSAFEPANDLKAAAAQFAPAAAAGLATVKNNSKAVHFAVEGALALALVVMSAVALGLHSDKQALSSRVAAITANPQALVQQQTDALIGKVGALMNLPSDEKPTVADVTDAAQARQQSNFFADAQNGDKVLMYAKAGEAILYRPSTNKITLVAPLTFNQSAASGQTQAAAQTTQKAATSTKTTTSATTRR